MKLEIYPWLIPISLLIIWLIVCETGIAPPYLIPHPVAVIDAGYQYIWGKAGDTPYAGRFLQDISASMVRVSIGFLLATLIGIPLGVVSGRVATVNRLISTTVNALRSVPGICWLPLAMVWFGIGLKTTVFLVALAAFFPIYLNAASGSRQVNLIYYQAGAMMGVSRLRGAFAILLPAAMPQIITGLRLGLGIAWAYLVLGELTGVPNGLGALIMDARMLGQIEFIVVGILLIAVAGRLSDLTLYGLMKLCFKSARRLS